MSENTTGAAAPGTPESAPSNLKTPDLLKSPPPLSSLDKVFLWVIFLGAILVSVLVALANGIFVGLGLLMTSWGLGLALSSRYTKHQIGVHYAGLMVGIVGLAAAAVDFIIDSVQ